MKKLLCVASVILVALGALSAQPVYEQQVADAPVVAKGAVMMGPSGFSSIALFADGGKINDRLTVDMTTYPSPNEVISRLANGELDFACLPTNVAANLYNKGVKIKMAAIVGNGMLSVLSGDDSVSDPAGLLGKTVNVPDAGSTPDQLSRLLLMKAGLEEGKDIVLDYSVASPAQIAQMLIAGKISYGVLPQPFVSMVLTRNPKVRIVADIQELYAEYGGARTYPITVLVVSDAFAQAHPLLLQDILDAYEASVAWVNANPDEAGAAIEEQGIMQAALATPAIPFCNLVYVPSSDARASVDAYFAALYAFSPASIGGEVPGVGFYL